MCLLLLETRVLIDTPALFLVIFRVDKPEFRPGSDPNNEQQYQYDRY
ncbi:MAG: hypothetical protein AB2551_05195 [Candidatus Thiodiazotropha sp.]